VWPSVRLVVSSEPFHVPPPASAPPSDVPLVGEHDPLVESQYQNVTLWTPEPGSPTPVAERPSDPVAVSAVAGVPSEIVGATVSTNVTSAVCVIVTASVESVAVYVTV
jgi:hypothetical protein